MHKMRDRTDSIDKGETRQDYIIIYDENEILIVRYRLCVGVP
jgi:hypothetical protein